MARYVFQSKEGAEQTPPKKKTGMLLRKYFKAHSIQVTAHPPQQTNCKAYLFRLIISQSIQIKSFLKYFNTFKQALYRPY